MVTVTAIWITPGEYSNDRVPSPVPTEDFTIQWSGQNSGKMDHKVARGTFVFYREHTNTPFTYIGRVKRVRVITESVPKQVTGVYELLITTGNSTGRVFEKLPDESGTGCFKRSVVRALGWSFDSRFVLNGVSEHDVPRA